MAMLMEELRIPNEYKFREGNSEGNFIKNLSKVNIIVGANNQGKSRFLRSLFPDEIVFKPNNKDIENINLVLKRLRDTLVLDDTYIEITGLNLSEYLKDMAVLQTNSCLPIYNAIATMNGLIKDYQKGGDNNLGYDESNDLQVLRHSEYILKEIENGINGIKLIYPYKKIYIPILRGLRPVNYNSKDDIEPLLLDGYQMRTKHDYFDDLESNGGKSQDLNENITIFTGLNAYKEILDYMLNEDDEKQEVIEEFQKYLSINFFDKKQVKITPVSTKGYNKKNVIKVKIGNEEGKLIYDLGDGIQSIIIMTLPLFLYKGILKENEKVLVLIEEPEHLLHPGLQRKLFDLFFDKRFEDFQFFFTTHSNHFLDITVDYDSISIYSINKELKNKTPSFYIENLSKGDSNALELLGVRNSSVFLSNCTIWVEGITDVGYLRHYLNIYMKDNPDNIEIKDIKEDYHYSFVEYGGNNITHWSFLDNIEKPLNVETLCGRLFLIVDKDEGKDIRHEKLKDFLGSRLHVLGSREIENLVSPEILIKIVGEHEKGLENIKKEINHKMYQTKSLGKFIDEEMIINEEKRVIKSYGTSSGTIRYKDTFLKDSKKYIKTWNDLSEDAQKLTREVYNFIIKSNYN
jgi:predicted ATP-dependent endonuclease of OLD family